MTGSRSYIPLSLLAFMTIGYGGLDVCYANPVSHDVIDSKTVPAWVKQGTVSLKSAKGRRFQGVGSARLMGSVAVQSNLADTHARAEVRKLLGAYLHAVNRDPMDSKNLPQAAQTSVDSGKHIASIIKEYFSDIPVIEHWRDMDSGIVYALAELNLEQVKGTLEQAKTADQALKVRVNGQGDTVFDAFVQGKKQ